MHGRWNFLFLPETAQFDVKIHVCTILVIKLASIKVHSHRVKAKISFEVYRFSLNLLNVTPNLNFCVTLGSTHKTVFPNVTLTCGVDIHTRLTCCRLEDKSS